MPTLAPFPPLLAYALAHACPVCAAAAGGPCDAPRKAARVARVNQTRARYRMKPVRHDPLALLHAPRIDLGSHHRGRDIGSAPWPEERTPGQRYDTLALCEFQLAAAHWRLEQYAQQLGLTQDPS